MLNSRLKQQMAFIIEIDKLKNIFRQTLLMNGERRENDAEHSWHLAMMAMILAEYASDSSLDLSKVIRMVLIHDIVEIDAGDTFIYDLEAAKTKAAKEKAAADRIFGLLPEDQQKEFRLLWDEFEAKETSEAKFAGSLDRLHPLLHNYQTQGAAWKKHGITSDRVLKHNKQISKGSEELWDYAEELIRESVRKGFLKE